MRSFTFNENIMCALINTGYLKSALIIRGDASVYPRFLVRLLQRNGKTKHTRNSPKLQHVSKIQSERERAIAYMESTVVIIIVIFIS